MERLIILTFVAICVFSCKSDPQQTEPAEEIPVVELVSSSHKTGPCQSENHPCFEIKLNIPELKAGTTENILRFNAVVDSLVVLGLKDFTVEAREGASKDELIEMLFTEYNAFAEGVDDSSGFMNWVIEIKGEIVYQSKDMICFSFENYSFTGGAHPNTFILYYNYNFTTNSLIKLEDIISDTSALTQIAESIFRTQYQLSADQNLSEKGFIFDDDQFKLNGNFAWTGNHIIFRFNPYEIGPYAMGPQEIRIPAEAVKDLLITKSDSTN